MSQHWQHARYGERHIEGHGHLRENHGYRHQDRPIHAGAGHYPIHDYHPGDYEFIPHRHYQHTSYHHAGYWGRGGWYGWGWSGWWGPYGYWGLGVTMISLPYYWTVAPNCYLYNGVYYQRVQDNYVVITPPVGTILVLPDARSGLNEANIRHEYGRIAQSQAVDINNKKYLLSNGVYYEKVDANKATYKIAGTDAPLINPTNPTQKYVQIDGVYYEKVVDPDNEKRVQYTQAPAEIQQLKLQELTINYKPFVEQLEEDSDNRDNELSDE